MILFSPMVVKTAYHSQKSRKKEDDKDDEKTRKRMKEKFEATVADLGFKQKELAAIAQHCRLTGKLEIPEELLRKARRRRFAEALVKHKRNAQRRSQVLV